MVDPEDFRSEPPKSARLPHEIAAVIFAIPLDYPNSKIKTVKDYLETTGEKLKAPPSFLRPAIREELISEGKAYLALYEALVNVAKGDINDNTRNVLSTAPGFIGKVIASERRDEMDFKEDLRSPENFNQLVDNTKKCDDSRFPEESARAFATSYAVDSQIRARQFEAVQSELIALNKSLGIDRAKGK
ncbi:MAG: hypothetical protein KGJ06_00535 [Pseudomonadota bacterium]|nr:hypothetical protein [Pseudomonadota bacterium]